jgi:hypothetical protein
MKNGMKQEQEKNWFKKKHIKNNYLTKKGKKSWKKTYKLNWASNSKTLTPTCAREMEKREVSIYTKKK